MKSIKPGRGSSKLGEVGAIIAAGFGVCWCVAAACIGAWFMLPFGLLFIGFAIYQAVFHHHNATAKDRYSVLDIVDSDEEPDPWDPSCQQKTSAADRMSYADPQDTDSAYCPYCGKPVKADFAFCPHCGRKIVLR